jgi:tetratricopeptide (TPR) repeat protein
MPGHIFTRLGYWQESIDANRRAAAAGQAYAKAAFGEGVALAQSLHAMDYLAYAYLQKAEDQKVLAVIDEIGTFKKASPHTRGTAYAMAAIPARYALERRDWTLAAKLEPPKADVGWDKFPPAQAIIDFARAIGDAHTKDLDAAKAEIDKLAAIRDALKGKSKYWSDQVEVERLAAAATLAQAAGRHDDAAQEMRAAADLDDATDKSNVTPGDILPPRELLGDLLLEQGKPAAALAEYKRSLAAAPNRFRSLIGEARAAKQAGDAAAAHEAYRKLLAQCPSAAPERPELAEAKAYLRN